MADETSIRVNFGRPMPLFPLAAVSLMPHAVLPLHIFEPRYRRMVADALDGPGQIAMAIFAGPQALWEAEYEGSPPLRPAVCVGQIVQHHQLPDGRYNIALHGVCRARIQTELRDEDELVSAVYRQARLEPVGIEAIDESTLADARGRILNALTETSLADLSDAETVVRHLRDEDVPTSAILELISFSLFNDPELRYALLAEGDVHRRAAVIQRELRSLRALLDSARRQRAQNLPKGCHWN